MPDIQRHAHRESGWSKLWTPTGNDDWHQNIRTLESWVYNWPVSFVVPILKDYRYFCIESLHVVERSLKGTALSQISLSKSRSFDSHSDRRCRRWLSPARIYFGYFPRSRLNYELSGQETRNLSSFFKVSASVKSMQNAVSILHVFTVGGFSLLFAISVLVALFS